MSLNFPGGNPTDGEIYTAEDAAYKWDAAAGGGQEHNNIQPSIAVYMWKRTA